HRLAPRRQERARPQHRAPPVRRAQEALPRGRGARRASGLVDLTFHGTPADYFDSLDFTKPYVPADFERDGFIHCTDGERRLADTLSAYYSNSPGEWFVLYIDKDRLTSEWKYEDDERVFPHIYGPLNRDAIVQVRPIGRMTDGRFLAPQRYVE